MRKILLLLGLLLCAVPASATIALTGHNLAQSAASPVTTTATNMTGSTLLVVVATCKNTSGVNANFVVTDSTGANTWTPLTQIQNTNANNSLQIFYAVNPTVSGTQTFTLTEGTACNFLDILPLGFSGTLTTSAVFDAQSGALTANPTTTAQPGSITPAGTGEVFVTGAANNATVSAFAVDSGFTITDSQTCTSECVGAAYLVLAGSGAQNPTWTFTGNSGLGINAVMATFKPAISAPPGTIGGKAGMGGKFKLGYWASTWKRRELFE